MRAVLLYDSQYIFCSISQRLNIWVSYDIFQDWIQMTKSQNLKPIFRDFIRLGTSLDQFILRCHSAYGKNNIIAHYLSVCEISYRENGNSHMTVNFSGCKHSACRKFPRNYCHFSQGWLMENWKENHFEEKF